jgi:hypothetical protein
MFYSTRFTGIYMEVWMKWDCTVGVLLDIEPGTSRIQDKTLPLESVDWILM